MGSMVINPIAFFTDTQGLPLQGGYVYIGAANTNPVTNPVTVYQDAALTIPMQQPLRTLDGCVSLNGAPQPIYVAAAAYSLMATDAQSNVTLSLPNYTNPIANQIGAGGAAQIGFNGTTLDQVLKLRLNYVANSISEIRGLSSALYQRAHATGYYAPHDGGGGSYQFDAADTTSADNGGTILVSTVDGGRWKLQLTGPVSAKQFGARGNGIAGSNSGNDDTVALQNWLSALSATLAGDLPTGIYNISSELTKVASGIVIHTDGASNSVINWIGSSTTSDLISLGDGTTTCSYWRIYGIGFDSAVKMTGGAAFHVRKFMINNHVEEIQCSVVSNNGNLYRGAWFDLVNVFYLTTIAASKCQDGGLCVNGSASDDSGSDLLITRGNIQFCGTGIHQGGGFGGLRTGSVNLYGNGINVLIDTTLVSRMNREVYLVRGTVSDSATIAGVVIDDSLTSNAPITIDADIGSSGVNGGTGPFHGLWIKHWPNGRLSVNCGQILNNQGNGIQADDASCIVLLSPTCFVFNQAGYGVASSVANYNIYNMGAYFGQNSAGNFNSNAKGASGDSFVSTPTAQSGALGSATATFNWTQIAKIATLSVYVQITNNGTGSGSIVVPLPVTSRGATAFTGKEVATSGKSVTASIGANSSTMVITNYDNSYPAVTGAVFEFGITLAVQ